MAIIGVAGGSGGIGRTIAEAIQAREKEIGASIIPVDYSSVSALTKSLDDNDIHTIISALAMPYAGEANPETNLIEAAAASRATKRLIPNGWAVPYTKEDGGLPMVDEKLRARDFLNKVTNLEYTVVHNGAFLDYWCQSGIKSYMASFIVQIDEANNTAALPGAGQTPVSFTHTTDVGKFVAALLDMEKWDKDTFVVGDTVTWNEFLRLSEDAKGVKFTVTYDSVEKLKAGQVTELPSHRGVYSFYPKDQLQSLLSTYGLLFERGVFNLSSPNIKTLNEAFPEIKPWTVKEALDVAWKKA